MKKDQIQVGKTYMATVSGRLVPVRVDRIGVVQAPGFSSRTSSLRRETTRYHVTNLITKRTAVFRSAMKFRREAHPQTVLAHQTVDTIMQAKSDKRLPPSPILAIVDEASKLPDEVFRTAPLSRAEKEAVSSKAIDETIAGMEDLYQLQNS